MKIPIILSFLILSCSAFGQWNKLPSHIDSHIYDIQTINDSVIMAVGTDAITGNLNGMMFRSTDSGNDWDTIFTLTDPMGASRILTRIQAINANIIYTTTRDRVIHKTDNGGISWDTLGLPTTIGSGVDAISFVNADTGYVANFTGQIYKTVDGESWQHANFGAPLTLTPIYDLQCLNDQLCFARTSNPNRLIKTDDGGTNWTNIMATPNTFIFGGMHVVNKDTIVLVSGSSLIFRTIDGGLSWDTIPSPVSANYSDVHFVKETGFAVGSNEAIIKSSDFGASWTLDNYDSLGGELITCIHVLNANAAVAASSQGSIYRLGAFTSIPEHFGDRSRMSVYPNPVKTELTLDFKNPRSGSITVRNNLGQVLKQSTIVESLRIQLDVQEFPVGLLFLNFTDADSDRSYSVKILKSQ